MNYTRETLIELCEQATVQEVDWTDRDSAKAQQNIGQAWSLLKAGCDFKVLTEGACKTDENVIWVEFKVRGFQHFENPDDDGYDYREDEACYIPTQARLDDYKGRDWY